MGVGWGVCVCMKSEFVHFFLTPNFFILRYKKFPCVDHFQFQSTV